MAQTLSEQQKLSDLDRISFGERLGMLVEREFSERPSMQTTARLRRTKLKHMGSPEDVDYRAVHSLDRTLFSQLLTGVWI